VAGAYGQVDATTILQYQILAQGTSFDASPDILNTLASWLVNGDAWMCVGDIYDFSVIGRGVDRPGTTGAGLSPSLVAALAPNCNATAAVAAFAARLSGDSSPANALVGNKHFWTSDYQVHRRPGWTVTLHMYSNRTHGTECDNSENTQGEHLGDGVLNLRALDTGGNPHAGLEYDQIFPVLDWQVGAQRTG